ncbi:lmo0937 family membrane protein [Fictibacillus sp. WQ 8-8]|uniref:Lmo0937 family membrane protein n=1 Tax=Fictibacillus marinisediminis TaxID=2878389 RepID=A0A9X1XI02_9BACL|nr:MULTISPECIES: lmo0937 family membrane protein [Fictibacillus]MCK6259290.1 lmo0937 family membrane protein [Fictibacillus marinisediminis]MCQ6264980.1 lmo0937 family membrane protein [Fictibacillus sp. WQ 8-8]MED2974767.1 lmo0937 family membrane protein [Fictibacillus sp. B-59209]UZJ79104.1 lmo0937 family membrane protein [Fictibacillus sp. KU28468]
MIWTIIGILIVLWLLGLIFKIAGGIIHILLIAAIVIIVFKLIKGRRSA